ncbi:hypothetical protein ACUOFC_58165, partial [Escherichia sp. TWPC-MK]
MDSLCRSLMAALVERFIEEGAQVATLELSAAKV